MKIIFFSDTHLEKNNSAKTLFVERFLSEVCQDADKIFILGDLFEFFHGYDGYIYPWFQSIADRLKDLANNGTEVFFLEGNHEFHMGEYFESVTGVKSARELTMQIDGKNIFIAHGDAFGSLFLNKILRSSFLCGVMDLFGPVLSWRIAMGVRLFLSKKTKPYSKHIADIFKGYAKNKFKEGYDVAILAHSHIADMMELASPEGKKVYINTGDLIRHSSYALYTTENGFEIKTFK